jgi:hypothetical protein
MPKCVKCHGPLHKIPSDYFCQNCNTYISDHEDIFRFWSTRSNNENHFPKNAFEYLSKTKENNW